MLGSLRDQGLIDAVVAVLAPRLIGGTAAPGAIGGEGAASLAEAIDAGRPRGGATRRRSDRDRVLCAVEMFTGIVEEIGRVESVDAVAAGASASQCGEVLRGARRGDSIAVSGCCLTVTDFISGGFVSDVMPETFARTTLGSLHEGDPVNLEAALRHDGRVGGHLVTGHVDGVGEVTATGRTATPPG